MIWSLIREYEPYKARRRDTLVSAGIARKACSKSQRCCWERLGQYLVWLDSLAICFFISYDLIFGTCRKVSFTRGSSASDRGPKDLYRRRCFANCWGFLAGNQVKGPLRSLQVLDPEDCRMRLFVVFLGPVSFYVRCAMEGVLTGSIQKCEEKALSTFAEARKGLGRRPKWYSRRKGRERACVGLDPGIWIPLLCTKSV